LQLSIEEDRFDWKQSAEHRAGSSSGWYLCDSHQRAREQRNESAGGARDSRRQTGRRRVAGTQLPNLAGRRGDAHAQSSGHGRTSLRPVGYTDRGPAASPGTASGPCTQYPTPKNRIKPAEVYSIRLPQVEELRSKLPLSFERPRTESTTGPRRPDHFGPAA
jgi:hypothetical protein